MPAEAAPSFVWVESIPAAGSRLSLPADETHYLSRVCRARAGERVTLTDGRGGRADAIVAELEPAVVVEVGAIERITAARAATVFCGAPERGRADWVVEKLAELGIATFQPIDCERARWSRAEARLERWRRVAVAALRQSRRCFLLEVREPLPLAAALSAAKAGASRYLADPDGTVASKLEPPRNGLAEAVIGPAQGFSTDELTRLASQGYTRISLSDSRLRTETAAMAWAAWWSAGV